jgi:hypothetical protein
VILILVVTAMVGVPDSTPYTLVALRIATNLIVNPGGRAKFVTALLYSGEHEIPVLLIFVLRNM